MAALEKGITHNGTGYSGKTWNILGQVYFPKAVTDSTFAFETNSDPGQFVPVHIHPTQDEFILVQDGMLDLKLDGVWVKAKAGDLVRLPRGIPHGYFNKSDKPARALFWVSPTQKLEALFNQLHNLTDVAEIVRISAEHEVTPAAEANDVTGMPPAMKTSDGRFGYEAAGDPPRRRWCSCMASAARRAAWRGQLDSFGDRYHAMAWDMPGYGGSAPLPDRQHRQPGRRVAGFPAADRCDKTDSGRAFDRRHDRAAIAGAESATSPAPWCWRRPARRSASPTATGRRAFIDARLGPLDRGETMVSLAPSLVKELVGDDPDAGGHGAGARLHGRGAGSDLSRHDAGDAGLRPARRAEGDRGADAGAVGLKGQQCAGADDGEDGDLYSCARTMSNSKASAISPIWNAPTRSMPRWINSSRPTQRQHE